MVFTCHWWQFNLPLVGYVRQSWRVEWLAFCLALFNQGSWAALGPVSPTEHNWNHGPTSLQLFWHSTLFWHSSWISINDLIWWGVIWGSAQCAHPAPRVKSLCASAFLFDESRKDLVQVRQLNWYIWASIFLSSLAEGLCGWPPLAPSRSAPSRSRQWPDACGLPPWCGRARKE